MDNKIDQLLRSKYLSLFCALLNMFFAIHSAVSGNIFFFALCGVFAALCFKNYINAA